MAWSTRTLAELTGTTVKTIRYYHSTGLLEEPDRAANGYKQYGTDHLVRLLQIRRFRGLGLTLAEIARAEESDETFHDTVQSLDAQLAVSIERQQAIRAELADLLNHRTGPDVPAGFEPIADSLTTADRAMITISAWLYDEQGMEDLRGIAEDHQDADASFNDLAADADADAVRAVATDLAAVLRTIHERYPATRDPRPPTVGRERGSMQAVTRAMTDLYNPAQIEVLRQAYRLAQED